MEERNFNRENNTVANETVVVKKEGNKFMEFLKENKKGGLITLGILGLGYAGYKYYKKKKAQGLAEIFEKIEEEETKK